MVNCTALHSPAHSVAPHRTITSDSALGEPRFTPFAMSIISEAYILVTIPNATLTSPSSGTLTGRIALEYITFSIPAPSSAAARDVLLVLRLGDDPDGVSGFEAPLDPARTLTATVLPSGARRYVFHATRDDAEFALALPAPPEAAEDVELFHSVLAGYATDLRGDSAAAAPPSAPDGDGAHRVGEDLRGRFVLVNEDGGEIVGTLDGSIRVREDPSLGQTGHENDPVVVELPDDVDDTLEGLRNAEVLVRTIPREDRDWMMRSALFASHVISGTTSLLTSAMTSASNYYISHSTPSPHASGVASPTPGASPPPPPSRTLLLLQSPTTRSHLTRIYAVSGGAVKLSNKASAAAERLIRHAVGKGRASAPASTAPSPSPSPAANAAGKPQLPPRSSRGPSPPPAYLPPPDKPQLPPRGGGGHGSRGPSPTPPSAPPPLRTRTRAALSATLIISSLAASTVRLVDGGGTAVAAAVSHRYGAAAGENAALAGRTMRNVVLVYVDVRGFRAEGAREAHGEDLGQGACRCGEKWGGWWGDAECCTLDETDRSDRSQEGPRR
ncbi:hypothetical protein EDB84DRAFT_295786 [Lactarius hengduanensis]|nr:hypothetical protein EDB84DRAFT_295786 [Lactarius hengduanensis]